MLIKKTVYTLLGIFCLSLIAGTVIFADEATIEADNLNVRTEPGTAYDTITQVQEGDVYPVVQVQDDWVEIQLDNDTGWVSLEYTSIDNMHSEADSASNDHADEEKDSHPDSITIKSNQTQIRNGPSTDDDIIAFAEQGDTFDVATRIDQWYEIKYEDEAGYIFQDLVDKKTEIDGNPLRDKTIVIDAGHGGHDVGAISANDYYEKDFTDITARELERELTRLGAEVILTRPMDNYVYLSGRSSLANLMQADAFISIHYNSFPDSPSVTGINTYYYVDHDEDFAADIQEELINSTEANDRDIAFGDYQVLRQTFVPSVLLELGFISNTETEELLRTTAYQNKLVTGIINGLKKNLD